MACWCADGASIPLAALGGAEKRPAFPAHCTILVETKPKQACSFFAVLLAVRICNLNIVIFYPSTLRTFYLFYFND